MPDSRTFGHPVMVPNVPIWWVFISAVVLSAWWVRVVLGAEINSDIFVTVVQKLLREKNVDRCLKLTAAAGDAPVGRATRAAILAAISREEDNNRPASYRGSRPVSIDLVRARIRTQYDIAFSESVGPMQKALLPALLSPVILIAGAGLGSLQPEMDLRLVGGGTAGLLGWLYIASQHIRILSSRNKVFEALWPNLEILYHDRLSINVDDKPAYPWPNQNPDPQADSTNPQLTLDILEPGQPVRTMNFDQSIIKIGTLGSSHVTLTSEGVARLHAVIEISNNEASIIDLGATRQTKVNLEPVQKHTLADGDVISIGDVDIVVRKISPTLSE